MVENLENMVKVLAYCSLGLGAFIGLEVGLIQLSKMKNNLIQTMGKYRRGELDSNPIYIRYLERFYKPKE